MPQLYASSTSIKLQTIQNTTLNIGCILINTQHLHDETNILPLHTNVTNKTSHNAEHETHINYCNHNISEGRLTD